MKELVEKNKNYEKGFDYELKVVQENDELDTMKKDVSMTQDDMEASLYNS